MRAPTVVTVTCRVVRNRSGSPIRSSNSDTRVLTTDFEMPKSMAALVNEPVSTTLAKHSSDGRSSNRVSVTSSWYHDFSVKRTTPVVSAAARSPDHVLGRRGVREGVWRPMTGTTARASGRANALVDVQLAAVVEAPDVGTVRQRRRDARAGGRAVPTRHRQR